MSKKVFNMQGGKHSAAAYTELEKWMYGSVVANAASFVVSAGTGMNLNISTGAGLISDTIARRIGTDAVETAAVPTASASFNRIDTVVAYIDTAVTPTTSVTDNTNDILKFVVVAGTAASTPVAPTGAAIISAIGAGKPYMVLYDVLVPQNATNTSGMTFTDRRVLPTAQAVADAIVTSSKLATSAVTTAKIAAGAVTDDKWRNGVAFHAYATAAQAGMGASAFVKITVITTEAYDLGNNFNTSNQRFTAPVDGIYNFVGNFAVANNDTRIFASVYKNGVEKARGTNGAYAGTGNRSQAIAPMKLVAGDYIELYGWRAAAGAAQFEDDNGLALYGYLITRT